MPEHAHLKNAITEDEMDIISSDGPFIACLLILWYLFFIKHCLLQARTQLFEMGSANFSFSEKKGGGCEC